MDTRRPDRGVPESEMFENDENVAPPRSSTEFLRVEKILRGNKCVQLLHQGEVYRLQVTKQGKLLLTK